MYTECRHHHGLRTRRDGRSTSSITRNFIRNKNCLSANQKCMSSRTVTNDSGPNCSEYVPCPRLRCKAVQGCSWARNQ
ncbi:hypothetical protein BD410DRAFT_4915 [Rickenella mellea]|uniref:Uncharacterized protein n=1 Tax=Rickenella mellea TaxID=50990 RepID=A0A4R5XFL4_9AGAM|nr:hypothetical protein BD410DRAFT_4915 [Rickenella mellea]